MTVDLSAASGRDITIDYAVQGTSTATGSGTDYTLADGTKTISAGATSVNINVPTASDALDEDNETVVILLSGPTNSSLEDANKQMTLTITDDDPEPSIQFNKTTDNYAEQTAGHKITVDLSAVSGRDVSVAYTVAAGTPAATGSGTDYTLADSPLTISAGQSLSLIHI